MNTAPAQKTRLEAVSLSPDSVEQLFPLDIVALAVNGWVFGQSALDDLPEVARIAAGKAVTARGRPRDLALEWLLRELAALYERGTGLPATTQFRVTGGGQYDSPFILFCQDCLLISGIKKTTTNLRTQFSRALSPSERKKRGIAPSGRFFNKKRPQIDF